MNEIIGDSVQTVIIVQATDQVSSTEDTSMGWECGLDGATRNIYRVLEGKISWETSTWQTMKEMEG